MNDLATPIGVGVLHDGWAQLPPKIAGAVCGVMGKVNGIAKKGENKFHNYKFTEMTELLAALQPVLHEEGLIVVQSEIGRSVLDQKALLVTYAFGLAHSSGETWPAHVVQTGMAALTNSKGGIDDKAYNKCHTAARKYFLLALFQIPTLPEGDKRLSDGDADADEDKPRENASEPRNQTRPLPAGRPAAPSPEPSAAEEARLPLLGRDGSVEEISSSEWPKAAVERINAIPDLRLAKWLAAMEPDFKSIEKRYPEHVKRARVAAEARLSVRGPEPVS